MTTMSAREFNQDVSAAKRAAEREPVIITDRGKPSHVLLSYEEYVDRLAAEPSLLERLSMDDEVDFEAERVQIELQVPDL